MREVAKIGEVFVAATGDQHVIREEHCMQLQDGVSLCNSGPCDVEIDLKTLRRVTRRVDKDVRPMVVARCQLNSGRSLFILGEGRLVNLATAEGHPAAVIGT